MLQKILLNSKELRVYHAEAGEIHASQRVQVPLGDDVDPRNPPLVTLDGCWDREYLVVTDDLAV